MIAALQVVAPCATASTIKTIAGYAAIFGVPDLAGDIIERGAFAQSLIDVPYDVIRCLYSHDPDRQIGKWVDVHEDDFGLFVKGEIDPTGIIASNYWPLIERGSVDGLSIGFRTINCTPRDGGGRILKTLDLREVSVVTFPMAPTCRLKVQS